MNDLKAAAIVIIGFVVVMVGALIPSDTAFTVGVGIQMIGMFFLIMRFIQNRRDEGLF